MAPARDTTVLRKKAEAGRPSSAAAPMTPARAISQVLAKVAQDQLKLPLQVADISESRRSLADLPEMIEELSLIAMIEGPDEALGIIALPQATLAAFIEMRTMGRLAKAAPAPRRPTRIDAAMAADLIDLILAGIEDQLITEPSVSWAGGFRYASHLEDPRPLGLLLEDETYRAWSARLMLGEGGSREGGFLWVVPQAGRGAHLQRRVAPTSAASPDEEAPVLDASQEWTASMERAVLGASAALDGVLHRVTLPLSAVLGLKEGMELPIPADALERITLEGQGRRRVSRARLGQSRGMRALRLVDESREAQPTLDPTELSPGASPYPGVPATHVPMAEPSFEQEFPADFGGLDAPGSMDLGGLGGLDGLEPGDEGLPPLKIGTAG